MGDGTFTALLCVFYTQIEPNNLLATKPPGCATWCWVKPVSQDGLGLGGTWITLFSLSLLWHGSVCHFSVFSCSNLLAWALPQQRRSEPALPACVLISESSCFYLMVEVTSLGGHGDTGHSRVLQNTPRQVEILSPPRAMTEEILCKSKLHTLCFW